jgi:hypothetical protein
MLARTFTQAERIADLRARIETAKEAAYAADCRGDCFQADMIWECEVKRLEEQLFWAEREAA